MGKKVVLFQPNHYTEVARKVIREQCASDFWLWLVLVRKEAAVAIARTKDENKVGDIMSEHKDEYMRQTEKTRMAKDNMSKSAGKGKDKGKGKGGKGAGKSHGKGKRYGGSKSDDRLNELEIEERMHIPCMSAYKYEDGTPVARISHNDHDRDAKGLYFGWINNHAKYILEMGGEHTKQAQAYVLFGDVKPFYEDKAFHFYKTQIIKVPMANKKGEKINDQLALLVNVGSSDVMYNSFIAKISAPTNAYITMSYRIYKSLNDVKVYAGTAKKEGFMNHVNTTLKAEWIYPQMPSVPTSCMKTTKINDEESQVQFGYLNIYRDKLTEVLKRSGHNGATIWFQTHDETTTLIDLPRKTTHKEALEIIKRVGDVSLGLINKNCGRWSIRVLKDEAVEKDVKAKIDPALASIVGPLLMNMPDAMGCRYVLKGLLNQMTYSDVAKMIKEDFKWNIRPDKFIKSSSKYNNMIVFAATPPPQRLLQFDGTSNFVEIEDFIVRKPKTKVIDKIFEDYKNKSTGVEQWSSSKQDDANDVLWKREMSFGSLDEVDKDLNEINMTSEWFDEPIDEPDDTNDAPVVNLATGANSRNGPSAWEMRKKMQSRRQRHRRKRVLRKTSGKLEKLKMIKPKTTHPRNYHKSNAARSKLMRK